MRTFVRRVDVCQDLTMALLLPIHCNGWQEERQKKIEKEWEKIKMAIRGLTAEEIARLPKGLLVVLLDLEIIKVGK